FLFSSGSSDSKQKAKNQDAALAALFGGGGGAGGGSSGRSRSSDESLSSSDFWKAGVPDKPIQDKDEPGKKNGDEPELLDPVSAGNPINPQTGQPYPDSVMKQFDDLRKKFPGNDIIPRRKSPEETKKEETDRQNVFAVQSLVAQGRASQAQIDQFYDYQTKPIKDRLELLDYVLKEQGSSMAPDVKEQYDKILQMNKQQLTALDEARKRAASGGR
ncbi:MAG: hypothetical protein HY042_13080, partial [Spirochaetia bacterium]|nr:hypothetical protein [Spirochaetia bacterium]